MLQEQRQEPGLLIGGLMEAVPLVLGLVGKTEQGEMEWGGRWGLGGETPQGKTCQGQRDLRGVENYPGMRSFMSARASCARLGVWALHSGYMSRAAMNILENERAARLA